MKYLRKYNEGFDTNREWMDMSQEEREETSIPAYGEDDVDFIITKIKEKYPEVEDKADLLDMICWFEDEFKRDIVDEDRVLNQLIIEYGL